MIGKTLLRNLVLFKFTVNLALTAFTCETYYPTKGSDANCTCVSSNNIQWNTIGITLPSCTTTGVCSPLQTGYDFQVDDSKSDIKYKMTVQGYAYSNCAEYTCTDLVTSAVEKITLSISDFDNNSIVASEPGENKDGQIQVTTGCVFPPDNITVTWTIKECKGKDLIKGIVLTSDNSTCTSTCNGFEDKKVTSGFSHTQYSGPDPVEVHYQAVVTHTAYPGDIFTWTSAKYQIKGCPLFCEILAILSAVFWFLGKLALAGIPISRKFVMRNTVFYILDAMDLVPNILSLIFGSYVQKCYVSDCCPDWNKSLGKAFIVLSTVAGLFVDIVIFILLKKGFIKPGKNGVPTADDLSMTTANTKKKTQAESFKGFEKEQLRLKIPQDPMNWNETQVEQWLNWAKNEFTLEGLKVSNFKMPGSELCRMDKEKFLNLAPHNKGDILWNHLDTMKKDA